MAALDLVLLKVENGPEFGAEGERINLLEKFTENGKRCTFAGEPAVCAAHGTAGSTNTIVLSGKRGEAANLAKKECSSYGSLASSPIHQFSTDNNMDDVLSSRILNNNVTSSPGALWLQMPVKPSPSPTLQEVARGDLRKLYKGKLTHHMKEIEIEASLVLDTLPHNVLVIVVLQSDKRLLKDMLQWKKRCLSGGGGGMMMASTWSNNQEELLRYLLHTTQIGYALLSVSR